MPVDTKASEYHWYMDVEDEARIVRWVWKPGTGVIESSMSVGTLEIQSRDSPDDEWTSHKQVTPDIIWTVAQNVARGEGFVVEVPIYS